MYIIASISVTFVRHVQTAQLTKISVGNCLQLICRGCFMTASSLERIAKVRSYQLHRINTRHASGAVKFILHELVQ